MTIVTLIAFSLSFAVLGIILFHFWSHRRETTPQLGSAITDIFGSVQEAIRHEISSSARQTREEVLNVIKSFEDSMLDKLLQLMQRNEEKLEKMRETVQERLKALQAENVSKLDEMKAIVDKELHDTLDQRLFLAFKQVNNSIDSVQKGLGEMQVLASSVGDLKKVLTNVKDRGTWGEIQLGMLLEQILTPQQYSTNVITKKGATSRVEFAIKLPGRGLEANDFVWLPIDAKFPKEDYERLVDAEHAGDYELKDKASRNLEARIKAEAKDIKEKYLDPPNTTDFGIMYLPTEGLYAEVSRKPELIQHLQRLYRVVVSGPNNLAAFLNSLQMGFKTLAIQKRSSEVWGLLSAVKTEFSRFADILERTKKKLKEASDTIEDASSKTRTIQKRLTDVQKLPRDGEHALSDDERVVDFNSRAS